MSDALSPGFHSRLVFDAARPMNRHAGFQEDVLGSLTPGKYADFVVLDQDVMRAPAETILQTRVVSTWVGGRMVYEAKGVER